MYKRGIDSPRMVLPDTQDKLFVTKAIGKYEPIIAKKSQEFRHDPNIKSRRKPYFFRNKFVYLK